MLKLIKTQLNFASSLLNKISSSLSKYKCKNELQECIIRFKNSGPTMGYLQLSETTWQMPDKCPSWGMGTLGIDWVIKWITQVLPQKQSKNSRVCKFYWWVESVWLLLHKFWSHFVIFGVRYHNEKSHFQTFRHVVLACIHYREGYTN